MYEVLTGKQRSLVFPIMCNAFVKMDYSDNVPNTGDSATYDDVGYGLWAHEGSFSFEALITPYDINGNNAHQAAVALGVNALGVGNVTTNLISAYQKMNETMLGSRGAEALGASRDPNHKSAAHHIDYHLRQHSDFGKSSDVGHQDRLRHQVANKLGYSV